MEALATGPAQDAVQALLDRLVAEGSEIGIQVCAYQGETCVVDAWSGVTEKGGNVAVTPDTLFNVFSVTKAVCSTAVHMQVERGLVDYDAPVATYWPEFAAAGKGDITVRQVLSHVSGVYRMPPDVTPELMTNWDWMCRRIAEMPASYPAGSRSSYQAMTFGWLTGEIVRRTDPKRRPFGQFIRDEIALPLGADDLWVGIDDAVEPRVATLDPESVYVAPDGNAMREATPLQVDLMPHVFELPFVRRATIGAVGGIFNARSCARLWAMLANCGTLGGVRLLSADRVESFTQPRPHFDDADPVFFGMKVPIAWSGYWLGGDNPPVSAPRNPRALSHPGMGGNIGWADLDSGLAVAFCHNRMFDTREVAQDHRTLVGDTIRAALGQAAQVPEAAAQ
ncbi:MULTISPECIES: serine hydrolase domain-containing protein [unclassified Sphingobium]|uniref:serine hydrolase domain-containing protein n=1 Tax=unclassified Sphingobium TaxID=2611147 RepID=UPI000D15FE39|nr:MULTISPECIES: serine hydrolase domain-containing protein [unclassified Sphingobium]MBG6120034.1 CubicO group peptidase (beta-lactamase class C family) [Sphingobium sp. JAI105]PSO12910.1 EstA family serine hydrolase [Sphingobium sp. AEW4]TWD05765.1 CubicO group peptidase (beta-lactamase class C family) [Sphingobium sp. AEW010]TWD23318.1 CubicO group peptidase (beta-lactamase class C family) [Sphingobium sp. AEW013]TWD25178.1 CubicO group peptidase (beta-lactamase class C family) [Sphingobium